jgi:predicted transport protein
MDELKLKLSTKFMKGIISKFIAKTLFKKFGCNVDVLINEIEVKAENGKIHLHMDVDGEVDNDGFVKIIKNVGLD